MTIVKGLRIEPRRGYVMMYIASPLIPTAFINIPAATFMEAGPAMITTQRYPAITLAIRTNFYCNGTGVDRVMWDGYTRVGVTIK